MNTKVRILHLEDSETDAELIRQILIEDGLDCDIIRSDCRENFIQELEKKNFDLIFADNSLPQFNGLRALVHSQKIAPEIPFIFVSGTLGEDTAIESLRNGATDYVLKQRLSRLVPAVRRALADAAERNKMREMEERLRQAQRLEAVGTLAGGVAHDFNNILTIIKGHVSLLSVECEKPERIREIGATLDRAARRGTDLIKQLLAFARKSDGSFTSTDINQRVREIGTMLREAFPRNITFELKLQASLPEILADPGQVERVIINLATNARDAMPDGGKITFSTILVPGKDVPFVSGEGNGHSYLCLRVTDTGIGMDEATRQHIFEPFFTTKPKGQGTGLGMPVVYGLMQSHNGVVDVWSEPGKGTAVSLYFPVPETSVAPAAPAPVEPAKPVQGTETVLIVDDESDVRYFLQIILEMNGYRVLSVPNAEEAIELFEKNPDAIHLIFSDIGLPKMDGFGLSVRARHLNPGVKFVLASGYIDGSIKTRVAEQQIDGFMSKPFETPALLQTVRSVLDKAAH